MIKGMVWLLCGLSFLLVFSLGGILRVCGMRARTGFGNAISRLARKCREGTYYERTAHFLEENGARFHLGVKVDPLAFLLLRMGLSLAGFVVFVGFSVPAACLAAVSFYFLPVALLMYLNRRDNLNMLSDIKLVYHSLEIQTRAGVYVTDALAESYGSVREGRLKQALLELAGDLVMRANFEEALARFQGKFDNRYLDSLCLILLQATQSGQSVDLLSDLSEQIKDMEAALLSQKKEALDRSVTFYQLGILVAIMGVVLYACVTQMFAAANGF